VNVEIVKLIVPSKYILKFVDSLLKFENFSSIYFFTEIPSDTLEEFVVRLESKLTQIRNEL